MTSTPVALYYTGKIGENGVAPAASSSLFQILLFRWLGWIVDLNTHRVVADLSREVVQSLRSSTMRKDSSTRMAWKRGQRALERFRGQGRGLFWVYSIYKRKIHARHRNAVFRTTVWMSQSQLPLWEICVSRSPSWYPLCSFHGNLVQHSRPPWPHCSNRQILPHSAIFQRPYGV